MPGYERVIVMESSMSAAKIAQHMLQDKGLIYEQKHEGWYSITDECFYPQSGVQPWVEPSTGKKIMVRVGAKCFSQKTKKCTDIDRDWCRS